MAQAAEGLRALLWHVQRANQCAKRRPQRTWLPRCCCSVRVRQQRPACSAHDGAARRVFSSACAGERERTLHASDAAAQSPRLR
jgi:hypothetical protein